MGDVDDLPVEVLLEQMQRLQMREIAKAVHLLLRVDLTTGDYHDIRGSTTLHTYLHIAGAVMIGDGNHLHSTLASTGNNAAGTHLQAAAGRQTGVDMQISVVPGHNY